MTSRTKKAALVGAGLLLGLIGLTWLLRQKRQRPALIAKTFEGGKLTRVPRCPEGSALRDAGRSGWKCVPVSRER